MPIIVGAPRSGTTLLRFMLDAHPDLAIPPETGFLSLAPHLSGGADPRERFFRAVTSYPKDMPAWPDFGIDESAFRAALYEVAPFTPADGFRLFYELYARRFAKSRWGDKTPMYCGEIETIRSVLPEARFIHVIRDGRDVALSWREQWFSPGSAPETLAHAWQRAVTTARRAGRGAGDYMEVRYEDLVVRPRDTLDQICDFIRLDFSEEMLRYHERVPERLQEHRGRVLPGGEVLTDEQRRAQQAKTMEPPDPSCVFAWRQRMGVEERRRFEAVATPLLEELGYPI